MTKVLEKLSKEDAIKDLYSDACRWVDTSFNYIDVSVYEKMSNDCLYEHIVQSDLSDYANNFSNYITEDECKDWITDFLGNWDSDNSSILHDVDIDENKLYLDFYKKVDGQYSLDVMKEVYGDAILIGYWRTKKMNFGSLHKTMKITQCGVPYLSLRVVSITRSLT